MNQQPMMPQGPAPTQQPMAPAPWEPKPLESPVERAMNVLTGALVDLDRAVGNLLDRVHPVLSPQAPTAGGVDPSEKQVAHGSELALALHAKIRSVTQATERLEAITSRVEL